MGNIKIYTIIIGLSSVLLLTKGLKAQSFDSLDKNPHDIVYYRTVKMNLPQVKVVYGRPEAEDQKVFGTQVPYGKIWITGSDESTEIKFYQDVMFGNKFVKAGTYVLYTIPNENFWTIILNKKTDTYGVCFYDPNEDVAKLEVPTIKGEMLKSFSIGFKTQNYGSQMVLGWAKTRVLIPLYTESRLISEI
jgi:hypothetical protein